MPVRGTFWLLVRLVLRIGLVILLILAAGQLADLAKQSIRFELPTGAALNRGIVVATVSYIGLLAVPFVPGAEIGIAMLSMFGASIAPLIYGATVASLMLAFGIGRLIPAKPTAAVLRRFGLLRAADLIAETGRLPQHERLPAMIARMDPRYARLVSRYRYIALALAINIPGNVIIGGGGGLAMMAGLCGLFAPLPTLLTIMLAVLPVPLAILLLGT